MLNAEGQEIKKEGEENPENGKENDKKQKEFKFNEGDKIVCEVNLYDNIIDYTNENTKQQYRQYIKNNDKHMKNFHPTVAAGDKNDQIKIDSRSDFPLHFTLLWDNEHVDLDLHSNIFLNNYCIAYFNLYIHFLI